MAERNAINVLIRLLGGAEMTAELQKLGTTGEKAIKQIDAAAKGVSLANLGSAINAFGKDLATVAQRTALAVTGIAAGVAAAAPVILLLAKSGAEAADQAGKAAQAAGLQADAYQRLAFAAGEADVSQDEFNVAMAGFNKQIVKTADETVKSADKIGKAVGQAGRDIQQGVGFTVETFKDIGVEVTRFGDKVKDAGAKAQKDAKGISTGFDDLGIKVRNSNGTLKTNAQLLLEVANAFQKMPDGARKSSIAMKLFHESGVKLIPFLNEGAKGILDLGDKAADLGLIFSDEQIKAAQAFNDSLSELRKTVGGVLKQVGLIFAPAFTAGAIAFRDIINRNRVALLDFVRNGVQSATVFIKDFFAVLSGRDADVTDNKWLIDWRDNIVGFGQDFLGVVNGAVLPAMRLLREAAKITTDAVNGIFGTSLSAGEVLIGGTILRLIGGFSLLRSAIVLVVEAIAFLSRAFLANPWLAAIAAVAAGIALWVTRTDAATTALRAHEDLIGKVGTAYDQAGRKVAEMTQSIKDQALIQARLSQDAAGKGLAASIQAAIDAIQQFDGLLPHAADQLFDVFRQFQATKDVEAFRDAVARIGASSPELGKLAQQFLDLTDSAHKLTQDSNESADFIGLLTGKITDADFASRQAARGIAGWGSATASAAKEASAGLDGASAAADQTKGKVEDLGRTITVFRGGGPGGQLSKEVFDVVDGVARRADQAKQTLDDVSSSARSAGDAIKGVSNEVTNSVAAVPDAIKPDAASAAVDGIVSDIDRVAPAAEQAAGSVNDALGTIDAGNADQVVQAIVTPFEALPSKISTIMSGLQSLIQGGFSSLSSIVNSLASQINTAIARILSALREAAAAAANLRAQAASSSASSQGGSHGGFAGGGHLAHGPGTSTSDSIPIWASVNEFITQAKAVSYYGVDFFHALNSMALPRDFFKSLRGFRFGGAVDNFSRSLAVPRRMAAGGPVLAAANGDSGSPFILQLPGGRRVNAGTITNDAVRELQDFALSEARLSTGRKPGWA